MGKKWFESLDVRGWKALLFIKGNGDWLEEASRNLPIDSPKILRREQWIVTGDQYLYDDGTGNIRLGEWERDPRGGLSKRYKADSLVCSLEELVPLIRARLVMGESPLTIHPVLRHMAEHLTEVPYNKK